MCDNGGGLIINVVFVNGIILGVMQGIYFIIKVFVIVMIKVFVKECGLFGICVNSLLFGVIDIKFVFVLVKNDVILNQIFLYLLLKWVVQFDEMFGVVFYLVFDVFSYIIGISLVVDGGFLIG